MDDCLFCKIAAGEIPSTKIYEDAQAFVFADIDPKAPTHLLVIPKEHIEGCAALEEAHAPLVGHLFAVIAKLSKELGLQDFRVVSNSGAGAGQSVFHLHFHVLGGRAMGWPPG